MLKHLEPLPISEEMLGAYLEGNLTLSECSYVESIIQSDDSLKGLLEDVNDTQIDYLNTSVIYNYLDFGQYFMDFHLPSISVCSLNDVRDDFLSDGMINHHNECHYNDLPDDFTCDDFMNSDDID